jgi:molecular chaperone GrpE (heat shock protein)
MNDEEIKKSDTEVKDSLEAARDESVDSSEVLEFEFNEDGEEDLKKTLKKFRADLKTCKAEKEEYLTGWQKERAEFANYRKQEEDRKAIFSEAMRERILTRFLSVIDSFNMAFANKEAWEKVDENWRKGVEYIYAQIPTHKTILTISTII